MSYNIDTWKTKEITGLKIPLSVIHKLPYAEVSLAPENKIEVSGPSEGFEIIGTLEKDNLVSVSTIETSGEGSGNTWEYLIQCLAQSTGKLIAVQIWEGGDSITRLTVENGTVIETPIEL